jgi:4-amino-4-deoxy-L-arabinose transferase-like glycosyltransferase
MVLRRALTGPGAVTGGANWTLRIFLIALAAGLALVFLVFGKQNLVDTRFDPYYFAAMGKSLAHGEGFTPYGLLIKRRSPFYPMVIGALYYLFGEQPRLIQVLQCLLHAGTCALVFVVGRRLYNVRTGIIAGIACAFHPMLLRYVPDFHLETLLTFLVTLLLFLTIRFYDRPGIGNGAALGLVAGLATLTKAVVILYPGLFAIGLVLRYLRAGEARKIPWMPFAALFLVMALPILPWTWRNYRVSGHFVPVATGMSDAFLRGFVFSRSEFATLQKPPYTDAENEVNAWFRELCRKAGAQWEKDDWETDQILNRAAKEKLATDKAGFARKFAVGLFAFWYELTTFTNSLLALVLAVIAWAFALAGWRRARREGRPSWLVLLPVLYLNLILAALLALGRYSVPILPALAVLAAYGVDTLLAGRRAARA